jgi:polysaccharide deacetylase family protein (PEP-CTERM system associated)
MINALTIDLEDYFHIPAEFNWVRPEEGEKYVSRVERNTYRILDLLNNTGCQGNGDLATPIKATFFCFGWIAQKLPRLIRAIQEQGHEIASLGYRHHLIYVLSKKEFKKDILKAKMVLEDLTGEEIIGYRAPGYSITQKSLWALMELAREGFKYDSSIYPAYHSSSGFQEAPRFPFWVSLNEDSSFQFSELKEGSDFCLTLETLRLKGASFHRQGIIEFPLSTIQLAYYNIPISDGGHFHRIPYFIFRQGLKKINNRDHRPFIFYLHPWELGSDYPGKIEKREDRLKTLFREFSFSSIQNILGLNNALPA